MTSAISPSPIAIRRFSKFVAASTLLLIFVGAMVTSTGSGLAVPDWPLAFGMLFPPMIAGIFYEHGHRLFAGFVGALTVIQAVLLQMREPKRFVRVLGWSAVGAVIAQGLLGGLTVRLLLPPSVSTGHAALAELFLGLNVAIAFFASRAFPVMAEGEPRTAPRRMTLMLSVVIYLQILAGALMRHIDAGLAIPDFPLSFGRVVPPLHSLPVVVNFVHRAGALLVTALVLITIPMLWRSGSVGLRRLSATMPALLLIQIALGASLVWEGSANPRDYHSLVGTAALHLAKITSLHVLTGAALFASSLLATLICRSLPARSIGEVSLPLRRVGIAA